VTRILMVKPLMPYPPDQGTKIVTLNLLKVLSKHFEVSLICGLLNKEDEAHSEALRAYCKDIFTFLLPNRTSLFHAAYYKALYNLKASVRALPLDSYYCCPPVLLRLVTQVTRDSPYEVAQFDYWYTAPAARHAHVYCKALLEHDIDFLRLQRKLAVTRGFWSRRHMERMTATVRAIEVRAYSEFDKVLTLSRVDAIVVEKLSGIRAVAQQLPVLVDCDKYTPSSEGKIPCSIVFLGALDADFNVDALQYFCNSIFPLVRSEIPQARLFIVGRQPPSQVERLADGRVIFLSPNVEDIAQHVSRYTVQVVPLRFGGGVRIRILEGMAMGMPIVTTNVGMEGIEARPGRDLLVGDTPQDFAARVVEVLRSPMLASNLGERAREFVLSEHSEPAVEARVVEIYRGLKEQADENRSHVEARTRGK
jgi:glycosyltransferase involved in cell wall biosynthesis